jgi:hypothetical protein
LERRIDVPGLFDVGGAPRVELATKILLVLLNVIVFNAANIMLRMSNFSRKVKIILMLLGNVAIIGGTIYIILVSGV